MRPLDYDRLEEAVDLITHFRSYWDQCEEMDNPEEANLLGENGLPVGPFRVVLDG